MVQALAMMVIMLLVNDILMVQALAMLALAFSQTTHDRDSNNP